MKNKPETTKESKDATRRHEHEAEAGVAGAIAGAAMGAIAGPPGAVAGGILGGLLGAAAAAVVEEESSERDARDRALDAEIGVSGGEMGAPNLKHPPAIVGAYSAASAGAGSATDSSPAEGPIPPLDP